MIRHGCGIVKSKMVVVPWSSSSALAHVQRGVFLRTGTRRTLHHHRHQQQQHHHQQSSPYYGRTMTLLATTGTVTAATAFFYQRQQLEEQQEESSFQYQFLNLFSRMTGSGTNILPITLAEGRSTPRNKNKETTNQEDESLNTVSSSSRSKPTTNSSFHLIVPTMEASVRAWRLLTTVFGMVMDYEIAKLEDTLPMVHSILVERNNNHDKNNNNNINNDHDITNQTRRKELEHQVTTLEQELQQCQIDYTTPLDDDDEANNNNNMNSKDRRKLRQQLKQDQKTKMHQTAEELCCAKQELRQLGGEGDPKSQIHKKAAARLLHLCRTNGGAYIKVGQHLANLDYILPQEYMDTLHSLLDDAPSSTYEQVCQVLQEEFNVQNPHDMFETFESTPLASGSLAQVHVATCKHTHRKLAVKVQHYGLRETSKGDLWAVTTIVRVLERLFPQQFTFGWIADEIAPQLPYELDFCHEGQNAERAAQHLKECGLDDHCVVPKVHWKYTSARVLCMDFEEGFQSTDTQALDKANFPTRDVAHLISSIFNAQIFVKGFVHCDPHPANVLVRPHPTRPHKPQIVLVDHGLYKQLDDDFRIRYATLWKSLMLADLPGIQQACVSLNVKDDFYQLLAGMLTSRPFDEMMERSKTGSLGRAGGIPQAGSSSTNSREADKAVIAGYAQQYMTEIFDILGKLPRQMLLLLKMNDCLRHIDYALGSPTNTLVVAGTYASRALYEQQQQENMVVSSTSITANNLNQRWKAWMEHMRVLFRVQLHNIVVWWYKYKIG